MSSSETPTQRQASSPGTSTRTAEVEPARSGESLAKLAAHRPLSVPREARQGSDPDSGTSESLPPLKLRPARSAGEDTLLSAPAPADGADLELEDKVNELQQRLLELRERVQRLERTHQGTSPRTASAWLVLLAALLVVGWQVLQALAD